jgi:hypothetical protein
MMFASMAGASLKGFGARIWAKLYDLFRKRTWNGRV